MEHMWEQLLEREREGVTVSRQTPNTAGLKIK